MGEHDTAIGATWDIDTIFATRRVEVVERSAGSDVTDAQREIMARRVANACALHVGVTIHTDDVEFTEGLDATRNLSTITAQWAPATTEVEIIGVGRFDGMTTQVTDVWSPLRLPLEPDYRIDAPVSMSIPYVEFGLAGWRETERRWVFRPVDFGAAR